ncbi:MAG TPA: GAF domain-containing protein [Thermoanaerobaculia bacterium]|nr:GAF domain-containing protein [Thermoanaerobaculia bacterium]
MSTDNKTSYVLQARDEQQQYTASLLRENEKLRSIVAMIESDYYRIEEQHRTAVNELDRLRSRFQEVAVENERYAEQYQQIEAQSSNLANLYVASYQLHSSVDREAVLGAILEIVINLVGSEQVAVYERTELRDTFKLAKSFGVDDDRLASFTLGNGALAKRLANAEIFTDDEAAGGEDRLTACVPLKVGEELIGAILVFRLLDHKPSLQPVDHELFELLAVHASTALYCASLHAGQAVVG